MPTNGIAWNDYWIAMIQEKVWVDYKFIQGTAWYLNQDIMVVTTRSTPVNPQTLSNIDIGLSQHKVSDQENKKNLIEKERVK